jgi:hypothetical protein
MTDVCVEDRRSFRGQALSDDGTKATLDTFSFLIRYDLKGAFGVLRAGKSGWQPP